MDRRAVGKVCLALPSVTLAHPFGEEHDACRVVAAKLSKKTRAALGLD